MKKVTKKVLMKREKRRLKREFRDKLEVSKIFVIERDQERCQLCGIFIARHASRHVHHIIANCKKYIELSTDVNNMILLCPYCHKFSPDSPHQNAFYFIWWLKLNKPEQYEYLKKYLDSKI